MRRALAIDEQSFGPGHPDVARDLNNLAQLLQVTNRLAEAEPSMRRALAIFAESLGPDHPSTRMASENYRLLLEDIEAAKVPGAPLTRPQSGHPLPQGERETAPAKDGTAARGLFARLFGR